MGCAALGVVPAGLIEAELPVDSKAHFRGVDVFLAVILPPANGAKPQSTGRIERFVSTTRTTIPNFDCGAHLGFDGKRYATDYETRQAIRQLHGFFMSFGPPSARFPK
jgi:hypothetical protein